MTRYSTYSKIQEDGEETPAAKIPKPSMCVRTEGSNRVPRDQRIRELLSSQFHGGPNLSTGTEP